MRWPWRRSASTGRHALPQQRAAWAQPALPPPLTPAPVATPEPSYGVRLGFSDGTEVGLHPHDPSALALRAVADLLVQERAK